MDGDRRGAGGPGDSWVRDMLKGLAYAILILLSVLFYSGMASRFIYVDF